MSKIHMLELTKGQDVTTALYDFLEDKKWAGAIIVSGIGSVGSVTIGNPLTHDQPPEIILKKIDEPAEVLGFTGEIFKKNSKLENSLPAYTRENPSDYAIHIHIAISHGNGIVTGGGFRKATVLRALNIYIQEIA